MDRQVQIEVSPRMDSQTVTEQVAVKELAEFQLSLVGGGIGDTVL